MCVCCQEFDRIEEIFVCKFPRFSSSRQFLKCIVERFWKEETITETQRIFAYLSFIFTLLSAFTSVPFGNRFLLWKNRWNSVIFLELSFNCYCWIIEADSWLGRNLPQNHFWTDTATLQFGKACSFNSSILCEGNGCSQGIHEKKLLL